MHYESLTKLHNKSLFNVSLQQIINQRFLHVNEGWIDFSIDNKNTIIKDALRNVIGIAKNKKYDKIFTNQARHSVFSNIVYSPSSGWVYMGELTDVMKETIKQELYALVRIKPKLNDRKKKK